MKSRVFVVLAFLFLSFGLQAQSISTIEDYNNQLQIWGTSWSPGAGAVGPYYPSFYTGFVMRQENPERIHVRISRGNQLRVTVILDQDTIQDYLFDLNKRYEFYKRAEDKGVINTKPAKAKLVPQLSYFNQVIESPVYGILPFVAQAKAGQQNEAAIYAQSLKTLMALNPGHVFPIKIDLKAEFAKWKDEFKTPISDQKEALLALNKLVFGRVNAIALPKPDLMQQLNDVIALGNQNSPDFTKAAGDLFLAATGSKYRIETLNENGQLVDAYQCSNDRCELNYHEFTTIYPMGSAKASTTDKFGNRINFFATQGLWSFAPKSHQVDYIRSEPYYGFIPKMDYENGANGFHNPAVRFSGGDISAKTKEALNIPQGYNNLWAVKRGPVSHGCSRLPAGAVWEMRQIFPVENEKMNKVSYFGNNSQDFDVFDVDGNGELEVMGVEYLISYNVKGEGLSSREGADMDVSMDRKLQFYNNLYGARNVFSANSSGQFIFSNPGVSIPTELDFRKKSISIRLTLDGDYPLYEQPYSQDKIQFYSSRMNKDLIRLMGRVKGCAPSSDKNQCGEAAFDKEASSLLR